MPSISDITVISVPQGGNQFKVDLSYTIEFSTWEARHNAEYIERVDIFEQDLLNDFDAGTFKYSNPNTGPSKLDMTWDRGVLEGLTFEPFYGEKIKDDLQQGGTLLNTVNATAAPLKRTPGGMITLTGDQLPPHAIYAVVRLEPVYRTATRRSKTRAL